MAKKLTRLKITNMLLILTLLSGGLLGWQVTNPSFKVLETEKLALKDSEGRERMILFMDTSLDEPAATLKIFDDSSREVVRLRGNKIASFLQFRDKGNAPFNCYHINQSGAAGIDFYSSEDDVDEKRLSIGNTLATSTPYWNHYDPSGKIQTSAIVNSNGELDLGMFITFHDSLRYWSGYNSDDQNGIHLYDKNRKNRFSLGFHDITGYLRLRDFNGQERLSLGIGSLGANLQLFDNYGKTRTIIGGTQTQNKYGQSVNHSESSIWLFNGEGNSLFSAP